LYNVGSIFRTADAAGVGKIYLCGITPGPLDKFGRIRPQLAKVSLGAEKSVPWEKAANTARLIDRLKNDKWKIIAIEQDKKSTPYFKIRAKNLGAKTALVLGNEVNGLPQSILRRADKILEIPMKGRKESLNVSVTFGVAIFQLMYN
jgi:tRNA G18 (ribose-2'-O)-methylase SpoU